MSFSSYITVSTQFEGMHLWKDCPIIDVSFLSHPHRHIFFVELTLPVIHDDRCMEFFVVKDQLNEAIRELYPTKVVGITNLYGRSCEMLAKEIIEKLLKNEDYASLEYIRCTVREDNENGAGVMWEHEP